MFNLFYKFFLIILLSQIIERSLFLFCKLMKYMNCNFEFSFCNGDGNFCYNESMDIMYSCHGYRL